MKIVYIAGAYTGNNFEEIDANIKKAEAFAVALANRGIGFFCPHLNTAHFETKSTATYEFYLEMNLAILDRCDGMLLMPGWETSRGAMGEYLHVQSGNKNIKMFFPFPGLPGDTRVLDAIEKWAKG